ncbi:NAD(P)/FAD-dependent oxidoreductase [Paraburkholderia rhynchosiae]|uniref:Monomeric sarcosine oxidase n=2 Tax=Paraburkholderia rhynchosiae TaxID=487049 RepID=A0A6J5CH09_9BURK|nr:FAD-binding oxidoreductase [Paraburkholderia rhynchosiae]CAB3737456.1 Monomeric sarcosine oxidase [Paraburkholderia rhynchosiae]
MKPIIIVGGGVMGCSLAYFLSSQDSKRPIIVIERDQTYERASSALSTSSLRQQFSTPINIQLSQFGYQFMAGEADVAQQVSLTPRGYLFLAKANQEAGLRERSEIARSYGAQVKEYEPEELKKECPWLQVDDLSYAVRGLSGEGWFDGYSLMQLFKSRAREAGVKFVTNDVTGFDIEGDRVLAARFADGTRVEGEIFVNAAGPWSGKLAATMGLEISVRPRRRTVYMVSCPTRFTDFPILMDTTGIYVRPEQNHFILNLSPKPELDFDDLPLDPDFGAFEEFIWPTLAERIPAFEALRIERAWAGYYEFNTIDHNGLVGQMGYQNLYLATGFSGHGLMHSPGVGRGLAELITYGEYRSLDLSALDPYRFERGEEIVEKGVY